MSLNPITTGLRNMHYDASSAAKVQIVVQPGDTLTVSDDVADQLVAASPQFKDAALAAEKATPRKRSAKPKG